MNEPEKSSSDQAPPLSQSSQQNLIESALTHLKGSLSRDDRSPRQASLARQKESLTEWARDLGLLLNSEHLPAQSVRGGQEHDLWHEVSSDRYWKTTRNGVFGLTPGIDLALVSSAQDGRRFHLWEAQPFDYLERLSLHNQLVPGLNQLEGLIIQPRDLSIVTSQPRFDIVPVTQPEIDDWFRSLDFSKVTTAAYYRASDNLGIFDAHEKNLVRFEDTLIPFDIIPCHPAGGFLDFIETTLAAGHSLQAIRSTHTSS